MSDDERTIDVPIEIAAQGREPYTPQPDLLERTHDASGRGPLRTFDVFALIVNKMVGTGIYTAPASVFLITGNKSLTLGLFGIGFLYSLVSMTIYLDFAKVLPFNGGELIYMDEMTSHVSKPGTARANRVPTTRSSQGLEPNGRELGTLDSRGTEPPAQPSTAPATDPDTFKVKIISLITRFLGDGLFAYITYSIAFIVFFNSGTNSMQFGRFILLCIQDNNNTVSTNTTSSNSTEQVNDQQDKVTDEMNQDLMRFIGVVILSIICLLQYFSPGFGRSMNKTLAVIKLAFMMALFIVGIAATSRDVNINRADDWYVWHPTKKEQDRNSDISERSDFTFAKALLLVLFSYQGWENATFVAGEIPANRHHVLRQGFIAAVCTVGCLYLLIVAVFLHSITWDDLTLGSTNINYAPMLTGDNLGARRTWAIIAAISCFGSLNAIIYTFSRVKQAIGQAEILPWSRYLKQDDILQRTPSGPEEDEFVYKSPQGGLIVHWAMSVVVISATAGSHGTMEAVSIPGYMHTYIQCFFLGVLSLGFFNLKSREIALWPKGATTRREKRGFIARNLLRPIILLYAGVNVAILVINAIPPYLAGSGRKSAFSGYIFPALLGGLLIVSAGYYLLFFGAASRIYDLLPNEHTDADHPPEPLKQDGIMNPESGWNLMRLANVQCEIRKNYTYNRQFERVYRFGRRWRAIYSVPGDESYRPTTGQDSATTIQETITFPMFLYWLFGGTRLNPDWNPPDIIGGWWRSVKDGFHGVSRKLKPRSWGLERPESQ